MINLKSYLLEKAKRYIRLNDFSLSYLFHYDGTSAASISVCLLSMIKVLHPSFSFFVHCPDINHFGPLKKLKNKYSFEILTEVKDYTFYKNVFSYSADFLFFNFAFEKDLEYIVDFFSETNFFLVSDLTNYETNEVCIAESIPFYSEKLNRIDLFHNAFQVLQEEGITALFELIANDPEYSFMESRFSEYPKCLLAPDFYGRALLIKNNII